MQELKESIQTIFNLKMFRCSEKSLLMSLSKFCSYGFFIHYPFTVVSEFIHFLSILFSLQKLMVSFLLYGLSIFFILSSLHKVIVSSLYYILIQILNSSKQIHEVKLVNKDNLFLDKLALGDGTLSSTAALHWCNFSHLA